MSNWKHEDTYVVRHVLKKLSDQVDRFHDHHFVLSGSLMEPTRLAVNAYRYTDLLQTVADLASDLRVARAWKSYGLHSAVFKTLSELSDEVNSSRNALAPRRRDALPVARASNCIATDMVTFHEKSNLA